jgi:peroxin-16
VCSIPLVPLICSSCANRALLRFGLLRITRRPLVSPPIPERELDLATLPPANGIQAGSTTPQTASSSPPATPPHLQNNHVPLPLHPLLAPGVASDVSPEQYLLSKALSPSSRKGSSVLLNQLISPQDWLSESVYIVRPLIYGGLKFAYSLMMRAY